MVVDKVVPNALVDDGSGLNILPEHTMRKLGLSLTGPSPPENDEEQSALHFLFLSSKWVAVNGHSLFDSNFALWFGTVADGHPFLNINLY